MANRRDISLKSTQQWAYCGPPHLSSLSQQPQSGPFCLGVYRTPTQLQGSGGQWMGPGSAAANAHADKFAFKKGTMYTDGYLSAIVLSEPELDKSLIGP